MLPREVYEGEDVDLGGVEKDGTLWQIGAQLIGDMTAVVWLAAVGVSCANAVAMKADTNKSSRRLDPLGRRSGPSHWEWRAFPRSR